METNQKQTYSTPAVRDYGTLEELTANDGVPVVVDVPGGTPVNTPGGIVGSTFSP